MNLELRLLLLKQSMVTQSHTSVFEEQYTWEESNALDPDLSSAWLFLRYSVDDTPHDLRT